MIFLDRDLCSKRFNPATRRLVNLIDSDIGRPLTHIVMNLVYEHMMDDVHGVLGTLTTKEVKVEAQDGCWYKMRVRPCRTANDAVDGVILIFAELSDR
jgi:two-component system, chemotaxis family, CheB/CheR fusion protein